MSNFDKKTPQQSFTKGEKGFTEKGFTKADETKGQFGNPSANRGNAPATPFGGSNTKQQPERPITTGGGGKK